MVSNLVAILVIASSVGDGKPRYKPTCGSIARVGGLAKIWSSVIIADTRTQTFQNHHGHTKRDFPKLSWTHAHRLSKIIVDTRTQISKIIVDTRTQTFQNY